MNREAIRDTWRTIKSATKGPRSSSVTHVKTIFDGVEVTLRSKEDVEAAIRIEIGSRFTLAHDAPIMSTPLGERLRYVNDDDLAVSIIKGKYVPSEDLDLATKLVLQEIGRIGSLVDKQSPECTISPEDIRSFWSKAKERTSSSGPGIHFGHDKAGIQSATILDCMVLQVNLIASIGIPPCSWGTGVQVMLEKIAGVALVNKLRAIQLYEADFNVFNQFFFGQNALNAVKGIHSVPEELYNQKGATSQDATALICDSVCGCGEVLRSGKPLSIIGLWYARLQRIKPAICAALPSLQEMKIFQRTAFGDSTIPLEEEGKYFMGLGQGSRVAPASWLQMSSVICNVFRNQKGGASIPMPLCKSTRIDTLGVQFVDDIDLFFWDEELISLVSLFPKIQQDTKLYNNLLRAVGGASKGKKCFWYGIDYCCDNGIWEYCKTATPPLKITEADGSKTIIPRFDSHESRRRLGMHDAPNKGFVSHFAMIEGNANEWLSRIKVAGLPSHVRWTAYKFQLWPGVKYVIGTLNNSSNESNEALCSLDYRLLPLLGICRNITRTLYRLPYTFDGFGLFDFSTEQLIERINLFCQHYGTSSLIGRKLLASLQALQLKSGCTDDPPARSFQT